MCVCVCVCGNVCVRMFACCWFCTAAQRSCVVPCTCSRAASTRLCGALSQRVCCCTCAQVFEGIPPPYDTVKRVVVPEALRVTRLRPDRKYTVLGQLASQVGWKHGELVEVRVLGLQRLAHGSVAGSRACPRSAWRTSARPAPLCSTSARRRPSTSWPRRRRRPTCRRCSPRWRLLAIRLVHAGGACLNEHSGMSNCDCRTAFAATWNVCRLTLETVCSGALLHGAATANRPVNFAEAHHSDERCHGGVT